MANRLAGVLLRIGSTKFTIICIALAIILVVIGTGAQVSMGTFAAQKFFFNSWFVTAGVGRWEVPIFPGGLLIAALWLAALLATFLVRLEFFKRNLGLTLAHFGIIILLIGQAATQLLSEETSMPLELGQSGNYSESRSTYELALWRTSGSEDEVVSIPVSLLNQREIRAPQLPFTIIVQKFFGNSKMLPAMRRLSPATQGVGTSVSVTEIPVTYRDDEINVPAAYIQISADDKNLGTWLVSPEIGTPQAVKIGEQQYSFRLRAKRRYFPFSLTLKKFTHDVYPGTDIPRNFASLVRIDNPQKNESRDALIYMNHPLRYEGLTFYQASYGKNDTLSVFQVVQNPVWIAPYLSCTLVTLGLVLDLLARFVIRRRKNA